MFARRVVEIFLLIARDGGGGSGGCGSGSTTTEGVAPSEVNEVLLFLVESVLLICLGDLESSPPSPSAVIAGPGHGYGPGHGPGCCWSAGNNSCFEGWRAGGC